MGNRAALNEMPFTFPFTRMLPRLPQSLAASNGMRMMVQLSGPPPRSRAAENFFGFGTAVLYFRSTPGNQFGSFQIDCGKSLGNYVAVKMRSKFLVAVLCGAMLSPLYSATPVSADVRADKIIIFKSKHEMQLLAGGKILKSYKIALGGNPVGPKQRQGDHRTPEGIYQVAGRNANSAYHRSLRVSYPNEQDRARAAKLGVAPGGDIMIHGLPNGYGWIGRGHLAKDWTDGCIAVTDQEIEEIWRLVPDGTRIEIRP